MPIVSISELGYQKVPDTAPIEDRLFETFSSQGDNLFFLSAKGQYIPLPNMKSESENATFESHFKLATKIDEALNSFYRIAGRIHTQLRINGMESGYKEGAVELCYINTTHYATAIKYGRTVLSNTTWASSESYSELGKIRYYEDGTIKVQIQSKVAKISSSLFRGAKSFTATDHKVFNLFVNTIETTIDNLFIQQGFQASEENRHNLLSLIFGVSKNLLKTKEVQKLLGSTPDNHTIDNPNLIHLAAHGCNENMMKLFYSNNYYPESREAMIELASMPFDMLYGIWAGREQN